MGVIIVTNGGPKRPTGVARYWHHVEIALKGGQSVRWCKPEAFGNGDAFDPAADVIVVENGLSLLIPARFCAVAVQHGCAGAHLARVPSWPGVEIVAQQRAAAQRPNTYRVACSEWADHECARHIGVSADRIIYGCVDTERFVPGERQYRRDATRPVVLHHCADTNKGSSIIKSVKAALSDEFEFRRLKCPADRVPEAMREADIWLCLSASEVLPTVVQEAMATSLVVVGTDVGVLWPEWVAEQTGAVVVPWQKRGNVGIVAAALRHAWAHRHDTRGCAFAREFWSIPVFRRKWRAALRDAARQWRTAA